MSKRFFYLPLFALLFLTLISSSVFAETLSQDPPYSHPGVPLAEKNYEALHRALPIYQEAMLHPWPVIPETKKPLKIGSKNPVMAILRERLKESGDLPSYYQRDDNLFDPLLEEAVQRFQQSHGLKAEGVVGPKTLAQLNVPPSERVKQILINVQRWTTLSPQLNNRFIMVNIPDFHLYLYENNIKILSMKAVVGKPSRPTPELSSTVNLLVLNPYWNIPKNIAKKDIIPKVQENPYYLDEMHIRVFNRQTEDAHEINPNSINWNTAANHVTDYHFRQEPGADNALGLVKFEFKNSEDIYLHDTPAKELFDEDQRIFSSGCIRLEQPFELVNYLMAQDPKWDELRMQDILYNGKTTYIKAANPTPIIITYITAWVDDDGRINFREDVYGKDI